MSKRKLKEFFSLDAIEISSKKTEEGYLVVDGILARTGIQTYYGYELGIDSVEKIVLYRPENEVFQVDSIKSFNNKPVTLDHPPVDVTADNWKDYAVGESQFVFRDSNYMKAKLIVRDKAAIDAIESGKKQLSNGYRFSLDMTAGKTPEGIAYDGVQRSIRGNHIAIVDRARCGSACSILDREPANPKSGGNNMSDRKMVVDGIPVEVNDAAAAVIEKLQSQVKANLKRAEDAEALVGGSVTIKVGEVSKTYTGEQIVKDFEAKDKKIAELQSQVLTPEALDAIAEERAVLIADAKGFDAKFETAGKTCAVIRREILAKIIDGKLKASDAVKSLIADVNKASDAELKSAFNVAKVIGLTDNVKADAKDSESVFGTPAKAKDSVVVSSFQKFQQRSLNAWKGEKAS